ncbi:MAG: Uma2 family endonuclease [Gammaproteobacteria bacterium]
MSRPEPSIPISPEAFLAGEQTSEIKHEYVAGHVYAMAGSSTAHNRIALNQHLRGGPCRVFMSDVKLYIRPAEVFYYPDVVVTCDPEDMGGAALYISHPKLLVEVLSPSTERLDREEKRMRYLALASLEEYLLVGQQPQRVQIYRRDTQGWGMETWTEGETVSLRSVRLDLPMSVLYADL